MAMGTASHASRTIELLSENYSALASLEKHEAIHASGNT